MNWLRGRAQQRTLAFSLAACIFSRNRLSAKGPKSGVAARQLLQSIMMSRSRFRSFRTQNGSSPKRLDEFVARDSVRVVWRRRERDGEVAEGDVK